MYGLLVLASLAYCLCLFGGLDCWGRGDWDQFSFRFETPRTAILRDGQLPLWNPYVNGGNVLLAHPHCPALSPWYLSTLLLGAPLALRCSVVLFMALGAVGMAALLRRWEVSPAGCFAGGVLLMMSAHFAMHITEGHLEWCVLGLMPWVLLCLLRAADDWRFVIYGALLLASGVLYGSIYIVVVFAPLFCVWAVLESLRTRSWKMVVAGTASMALTLLLCAVVLFPRMEFLRANPRQTERHEQLAPAALGRMLLDPGQAALYRSTRDVRNPRTEELARILCSPSGQSRPYETLKWHRLEMTLATTSEWADVALQGFPYLLFYDGPDAPDKTTVRLNSLPQNEGWLRVQGPQQGEHPATGRVTVYARLPEQGHLKVVINQGSAGATKLTVTYKDQVVLEAVHSSAGRNPSSRTCFLPRKAILRGDAPDERNRHAPWYRLDAALTTTSDRCRVEVVNCPYLFHVEPPRVEARSSVPLTVVALDVLDRPAGVKPSACRASLYLRPPRDEDVRVAVTQGPTGTSRLAFMTPQGEPLDSICAEKTLPGGDKGFDYVLSGEALRERLAPQPTPVRWRLDEWGMTHDWQEYACYVTWAGLAMAALGLVVSIRRQWPLAAIGLLAGLIALGAALPVNFWALWKLLPMYGSLQVPSRFLAAVVFVLAVCGGYGVDRLGRWTAKALGAGAGRGVQYAVVLAIYVELAALGWGLFSEVFVCPKRPVPAHQGRQFAQRFAADDVRYAAMYSAHYPYLLDNSGVLREYENVAVGRGRVRTVGDPDYRGEAYLEGSRGTAEITRWSMSRISVALAEVDSRDRLVLNQNYFRGWKVIRWGADGRVEKLPAERSPDGLVSIPVGAGDREVEFYYLPDSFVWGALVSGPTLLGCLGLLLAGGSGWRSWRLTRLARAMARRTRPVGQSRAFGHLASAAVLNLPFLLCHPGWTLIGTPLVRSLAVGTVLLLAPGLPLVGVMIGRGWPPRFVLLWATALSLAAFVVLLVGTHLVGLPVEGGTVWNIWNGVWILTNLGLLGNLLAGGPPAFGLRLDRKCAWIGVLAFAVAYLAFFHAATRVVPVMDDHDYETQGTAYGLLTRLQMTLLTDRSTDFCYAHPPLVHACVAGSFLYFGQKDDLAYYDRAWNRVRLAEQGTRISARKREVKTLYDHFRRNRHHRLATRTPNVFLAALTVGMLGWWIARMTGHGWLGLLVPLAYATSPEVFVRSGYGGYFAISNFALVQILLAVERWTKDRSPAAWITCLVAGGFAALANHKLMLLPAAVVVWELIRLGRELTAKRAAKALGHPVVLGFLAGTALFWAYGLAVSPGVFLLEHFRHHFIDRITHYNPLRYGLYPTVPGLWLEFWQHTGYVLLPLGVAALVLLCSTKDAAEEGSEPGKASPGWAGMPGLWAGWALLTAVAFSVVDWRQTKHLMPLMLPLHLAPARCAARGHAALVLVAVLFGALLVGNLYALQGLTADFAAFSITPAW